MADSSGLNILIVTSMRDEGPFLLDWLAFHKSLGVNDFLVFTNDCSDGTDLLLDRLDEAREVRHVRQRQKPGKSVQWQALKHGETRRALEKADWAMFIDCDEFVNVQAPIGSIVELISAAGDSDAIILPWRLFGHAGHSEFEDRPVPVRFTRAAPEQCLFPLTASFFKTLFRAKDGPFREMGIHRPKRDPEAPLPRWRDGSGVALDERFASAEQRIAYWGRPIANDLVQLNHYSLRSAEDFMVKRLRGLPNRSSKELDAAYWSERNFNSVPEPSIQRHMAGMKAERERLLKIRGVAAAQEQTVLLHRARINAALADPDDVMLYGRLLLNRTSTTPDDKLRTQLFERMRKAHGGNAGKGKDR